MEAKKMKAVVCPAYGAPEVLQIKEIDRPVPGDKDILVKVMATPVNTADTRTRALAVDGIMKVVMRLVLGWNKPRKPVLGTVFAGKVAQVGSKVSKFKEGDEVYGTTGFKFGAHAEYLTVPEKGVIAFKPGNASFEEAAAMPFGGQTAIYFLAKAKIAEKKNPKVLIYGATGAVGTAALQIARQYQAEVTAVCSTKGEALARELGADHIIRYDQEDFTQTPHRFDIILDAVDKTSKRACKALLKEDGHFVTVGGMDIASESTEQLDFLSKLSEAGEYRAILDGVYQLDQAVAAHAYVDTGRKKGNVVLKMDN